MQMGLLETTILTLAMAVAALIFMRRIKMPAILGYLILGIIVGPMGLDWISQGHTIELMAELGIVFLLFAIGLEVSLKRIISMRRSVLWVGGIQVVTCMLVPGTIAYFLGMSWHTAFVASAALSLSSTAIVVRQLAEQNELLTRHGELSLAILLFQDLAAVPFLIIIPVLAASGASSLGMDLAWAFVKGMIAIAALLMAGCWLLRPLFDEVAKAESPELFTLTTLLTALATAWVTYALGLSMILGAFLAGLVLAETHHRHQIEHDIRPFRDVLLGLFFITVGMLLDFQILTQHWYWVVFLVVAIVVFKFIIISLVADKVGHLSALESMKTGLILAHGGEFGFILLTLAITLGVMEEDYGQVVLAGVLVTMFLCPLFIRYNEKIVNPLVSLLGRRSAAED
jgi:CPA2 family monovalent cation:H+ antiporter-2